jgi:hypothetical protein
LEITLRSVTYWSWVQNSPDSSFVWQEFGHCRAENIADRGNKDQMNMNRLRLEGVDSRDCSTKIESSFKISIL